MRVAGAGRDDTLEAPPPHCADASQEYMRAAIAANNVGDFMLAAKYFYVPRIVKRTGLYGAMHVVDVQRCAWGHCVPTLHEQTLRTSSSKSVLVLSSRSASPPGGTCCRGCVSPARCARVRLGDPLRSTRGPGLGFIWVPRPRRGPVPCSPRAGGGHVCPPSRARVRRTVMDFESVPALRGRAVRFVSGGADHVLCVTEVAVCGVVVAQRVV